MDIKTEMKLKITVGDVTLNLSRDDAFALYNSLKAELGIHDWTWAYPTYPTYPTYPNWTSDKTEPFEPIEPYTTCCSTTEGSSDEVNQEMLDKLNNVSIHENQKEIDDFLQDVKDFCN